MGEDSIKRKLVLLEVDLKIRFSPSRSPGTKSPVCGIPWYASARANVFFRRFLQPFSDTKLSYLLVCIAEDSIKRKLVLFEVNFENSVFPEFHPAQNRPSVGYHGMQAREQMLFFTDFYSHLAAPNCRIY